MFSIPLAHIEPILTAAARLYAVGGEIFTIGAIMWTINFAANLTEKLYVAGVTTGRFYKRHLHKRMLWTVKHAACTAIVVSDYAWTGAKHVYSNREELLTKLNTTRNRVGSWFVYPTYTYNPRNLELAICNDMFDSWESRIHKLNMTTTTK